MRAPIRIKCTKPKDRLLHFGVPVLLLLFLLLLLLLAKVKQCEATYVAKSIDVNGVLAEEVNDIRTGSRIGGEENKRCNQDTEYFLK